MEINRYRFGHVSNESFRDIPFDVLVDPSKTILSFVVEDDPWKPHA